MTETHRSKYWENLSHLYLKSHKEKEPAGTFSSDNTIRKTPKKFVAGNVYANSAAARPPSPLAVNFKWTPCSIKSDFYKLSAANSHLLPNN
jgi:hypothetical protein